MQLFGFTIIKTTDLESLNARYEHEYSERRLMAQQLNEPREDLRQAKRYITALKHRIAFQKELSQPRNPENGRLAKDSAWPAVDNTIAKMVATKMDTTVSDIQSLVQKFG